MKYSGLSEQTKIIARSCGNTRSEDGTEYYDIFGAPEGEQQVTRLWEIPGKQKGCVITKFRGTDSPLKESCFFKVDKIEGPYIEVATGPHSEFSRWYVHGKAPTVKLVPGFGPGTYVMDDRGSLQSDTEHVFPGSRERAEHSLGRLKEVLREVTSGAFPFSTDSDLKNLLVTAKDKLGMNPSTPSLTQSLVPSIAPQRTSTLKF